MGSLAMAVLWYARYRRGGGKMHVFAWEFSSGLSGWEEGPVPGQAGKRLFEVLFQKTPAATGRPGQQHHALGLPDAQRRGLRKPQSRWTQPRTWHGLPFGAGVWGLSYAALPAAGLYKPIRDYDRGTRAKDLRAHLVHGTAAAGQRRLSPRTRLPRVG